MSNSQRPQFTPDALPLNSINVDRSREKSLYFLLLAIGRQRATAKESIRRDYRTALKNLTVENQSNKWKISAPTSLGQFVQEIEKNSFHFYKTSLQNTIDETQLRNLASANNFWDKFETFLEPAEDHGRKKNLLKWTVRLQPLPSSIYLVSTLALIFAFPSPLGEICAFALASTPAFIMFPKLRRRDVLSTYTIILFACFIFLIIIDGLKKPIFSLSLIYLIFLTVSWMYILHLQTISGYFKFKLPKLLLLLVLVLNTLIYPLEELRPNFLLLMFVSIGISMTFPIIRRRFINNTKIIVFSLSFEIFLGCLLSYTFIQSFGSSIFLLKTIFLLLYILLTITWVVFLSLDGQTNMILRLYFPVLLSTTLFSSGTGNQLQDVKVFLVNIFFFMAFLKIKFPKSIR